MQHDVPALSVLVPTYDRPEDLTRLLEGLSNQTLAPSQFEVIVVDDGSPTPVQVDARPYPFPLAVLRQANAGPGAARNHGLERCRARLVLILNDDAVPAPDLLEQHLAAHERAPERTAVLGSFRFTEAARAGAFTQLLDESDLLFSFSQLRPGELHDWRFFWTCNISLPVKALRTVGGFDAERFSEAIVEDCELGYRLFLEGWRVMYAPECRCEHQHRFTPAAYLRRAQRLGKYLVRLYEKHGQPEMLWCDDEAAVDTLLRTSLDRVEPHRSAVNLMRSALEKLDEEYRDRALPESLLEQSVNLLRVVGFTAFAAGVHEEVTGVDPLAAADELPPPGSLTSIVVVSHDQLAHTQRCVEALRSAADPRFPTELLVVDNGSTDGSAEWLAAQEDLTLIANESNLGAPRARNQATARARGDWVAYLDNDVFVPPGWLGRALYHGAVDPRVGAVALVANRASKFQQVPYAGGDDEASIALHADTRYAEYERRGQGADLFTSLAVLVRRAVIDQVGGFDETFSPWGFEDDDLALRIRLAGWSNRVALDTFVFHAPYPDEAKHVRHSAHLDDNWARFSAKWGQGGPTPPRFDYEALGIDLSRPVDPAALHVPLAAFHERRDVVVLGAGRSGTSLVAGTLAGAGWFVGDDPYPGREANPKGFFETAEINGINEELIAAAFPNAGPDGPMQRWLCALDGSVPSAASESLAARIARLTARRPFAFKDPRFCYTLPAWAPALGDAGRVCVFRDPAITAESMVREVENASYLSGVELTFEQALEVWRAMYTSALEQRSEGDWLFVHADQLMTDAGLDRLERFVGAPVDREFPDASLQRTRATRAVPPEISDLYQSL